MQKFSLIVPTLNEADNIGPLLDRIDATMKLSGFEPEILFVDDGSRDGTRQTIEAYAGTLTVRLIRRDHAHGLAGAVVAGALAATHDLVAVMDADLSHPPENLPQLLAPLIAGNFDMIIGSRYVRGGATEGWPMLRRFASRMASFPAQWLTGIHDPLAGYFATRRKHLIDINRSLLGFKIGLELLAAGGKSFKALEVPIRFTDRRYGTSKMTGAILVRYLQQLMHLAADRVPLQSLLPIMLATLLAGLTDAVLLSNLPKLGLGQTVCNAVSIITTSALYYGFIRLFSFSITTGKQPPVGNILRYVSGCLLLLLFQDTIVVMLALQTTIPAPPSPILMGVVTSACLAAILTFSREPSGKPLNWQIFGTLLIGLSILLHLAYLGHIELLQEEAYYWNYSQHMAAGYLDHPPMVALLIRLGTLLLGNTELGVRIGAVLCWCITAFFANRFAERIFDRTTGFMSLVLVTILPIFFGVSLVLTPDAPLIACWSGALYFLYRALIDEHRSSWYSAGIWLGLGLASKYTIALLGPATILLMMIDTRARKWFTRREPYLAALLAFTLFSPVIWWNAQHDWASFLFQSKVRLDQAAKFSTHALLASILVLISPTGFLAALAAIRPWRRQGNITDTGRRLRRSHTFAIIMTLMPLSVFLLFSIAHQIKLNWTGPIWLALLPFMAQTIAGAAHKPQQRLARLWPGTLLALALVYTSLLHYCAVGFPGLTYGNSRDFLFGWNDLAHQVNEEVRLVSEQDGRRPLVAGLDRYRLASGLAFYRSKEDDSTVHPQFIDETTGGQLFGNTALMYEYWHPPVTADGRDVLVISQNPEKLSPDRLAGYCRKLGIMGEFDILKNGKKAGRYYYRLLTWYAPDHDKNTVGGSPPLPSDNITGQHTAQMLQPATTVRNDATL